VDPVEHRFSGGVVFKKPLPRDYGFADESGVENALLEEIKRTKIKNQVSLFIFLAVLVTISASMLVLIKFVFSFGDPGRGTITWLQGFISVNVGLVFAISCTLIIRAASRWLLHPSSDYSRARQYLDANRLWKRRLTREYGYESSRS
jgi:hypothetical protein